MRKGIFIVTLFYLMHQSAFSQILQMDSLPRLNNNVPIYTISPWLGIDAPLQKTGLVKQHTTNWNFYIAAFLLLLFGVYRVLFPKFVNDLLRIAKQSSIYTKQIREQVKANVLASSVLNAIFAIVAGVFLYVVLDYYRIAIHTNKFLQLLLCITGVAIVYLVKYLGLQFFSWVFQVQQEGKNYIFTVFFFNKIMAIVLLPIVCYLLIGKYFIGNVIALSIFITAVILVYRYVLCYVSVAKSLQMSRFHFFLYLCTIEIAPLLLLYKVLLVNYK